MCRYCRYVLPVYRRMFRLPSTTKIWFSISYVSSTHFLPSVRLLLLSTSAPRQQLRIPSRYRGRDPPCVHQRLTDAFSLSNPSSPLHADVPGRQRAQHKPDDKKISDISRVVGRRTHAHWLPRKSFSRREKFRRSKLLPRELYSKRLRGGCGSLDQDPLAHENEPAWLRSLEESLQSLHAVIAFQGVLPCWFRSWRTWICAAKEN